MKKQKPKSSRRKFAIPTALAAAAAIGSTVAAKSLTPRERETAARVLSGDADPSISSMDRPLMREAVVEALAKLGVSKTYLASKLKDGLEATETKFFAEKGVVTDTREVVAWGPRKAYLDSVLQMMGVTKTPGTGDFINNGTIATQYKSHLSDETQIIPIDPPKSDVIRRRMQAQKPTNRRGV